MSEVVSTSTATASNAAPATEASVNTSIDASAVPENSLTKINETESRAEVKALKEKFKLKVDGEELEEELDWNDKDTIRNKLQLAAAAKKRMAESVEAKKKAYEIVKQFEENPESMLRRLGPKGREIAEKYILSEIQEELLTPEEKEYRATKAELEALRKEKQEAEAQRSKSELAKKEFEYAQNFQNTIIQALDKSGLPKTPELVKRMASLMSKNLSFGLELTPDDLVQEVRSELTNLVKSIIADADGDHLINLFGDDVSKKIRMSDLKKLQDKQAKFGAKSTPQVEAPIRSDKRPMSMEEWKESLNERIKD